MSAIWLGLVALLEPSTVVLALAPCAGAPGSGQANGALDILPLVVKSVLFLVALGVLFGISLVVAARKFSVQRDPKLDSILQALAGAHCGACGFAGCEQYAEAVLGDPDVPPNLCAPAGDKGASAVATIMAKRTQIREPRRARIMCQGGSGDSARRFIYDGVKDCRAASLVGGDKGCPYGCLGYGTCARVCPFGAISMSRAGLPLIDADECNGCGVCAGSCPRGVIEILPVSVRVFVACHSHDKGTATRQYCTRGCIACRRCMKVCNAGAVRVDDNLARISAQTCSGCGLCAVNCPAKAIVDLGASPSEGLNEGVNTMGQDRRLDAPSGFSS